MRTANNGHWLSSGSTKSPCQKPDREGGRADINMPSLTVGLLTLFRLMPVCRVLVVALCGMIFSASAVQLPSSSQQKLTKADIDRMMKELSNWGRWGKEDQLGALNLITPAKRKQAAMLVKEGISVSLAHDTNTETAPDNTQPYEHSMTLTGVGNLSQFSLDKIGVSFHGYQHTHLDALCHMFW